MLLYPDVLLHSFTAADNGADIFKQLFRPLLPQNYHSEQ